MGPTLGHLIDHSVSYCWPP